MATYVARRCDDAIGRWIIIVTKSSPRGHAPGHKARCRSGFGRVHQTERTSQPNHPPRQGHPGYRTPTRAPVTRQAPSARVLRLVVVLSSTSLPFFPSPHLASKSNALRPPHPSPRPCVEPPHSHLPISVRLPRRNKDSDSDSFLRRSPTDRRSRHSQETMGHDEAVVTQISGKTPFPAKDQPAAFPYLDWSAMQSYYGPGILPPAFFNPGHVPPPFMWAPQNLPTPAFGKPYAAIYPHAGGFVHPFIPLMVNPLNAEPAKSVNSKDDSLNKKLKETDGTAVSTGSGNSEKTSGDYSLEGSSDGNNQRACETPKKRTIDDMTTSGAKTCGASIPKDKPREPGELATLANLRIPDVAVKPCASAGSDFRVGGTPSTEWSAKDDKELKRERRKQSNRESARRSRLRKQAETEELARKVELLTAENASLQNEINKLKESSKKLRMENSALMEKLKERAPDDDAQDEPPDQTHTATASGPNTYGHRTAPSTRRQKFPVNDGRRGSAKAHGA